MINLEQNTSSLSQSPITEDQTLEKQGDQTEQLTMQTINNILEDEEDFPRVNSKIKEQQKTIGQTTPEKLTFQEKIRNCLENQQHKEKIYQKMEKRYGKILQPTLKLKITSYDDQDIELSTEDIVNVFKIYDEDVNVEMQGNSSAFVTLSCPYRAWIAKQFLNKQNLKEQSVVLTVEFVQVEQQQPQNYNNNQQQQQMMHPDQNFNIFQNQGQQNFQQQILFQNNQMNMNPQQDYYPEDGRKSNESYNNNNKFQNNHQPKNTCRFDIQIQHNDEFQVGKKIIGSKGHHMKEIIQKCCERFQIEAKHVKLRLRGQGSGFKEGEEKRECREPLHLCVSCTYTDVYQFACQLVEQHIRNIYQEYQIFCKKNNMYLESLQIKKQESINPKNKIQYDKKYSQEECKILKPQQYNNIEKIFPNNGNNNNNNNNNNKGKMSFKRSYSDNYECYNLMSNQIEQPGNIEISSGDLSLDKQFSNLSVDSQNYQPQPQPMSSQQFQQNYDIQQEYYGGDQQGILSQQSQNINFQQQSWNSANGRKRGQGKGPRSNYMEVYQQQNPSKQGKPAYQKNYFQYQQQQQYQQQPVYLQQQQPKFQPFLGQ